MPQAGDGGSAAGRAPAPVAIGLTVHASWSAAVAVADRGGVQILDRRRLSLSTPHVPVQPYHTARDLQPHDAEQLVRAASTALRASARHAVDDLVADLRDMDLVVVAAGIPVGGTRVPQALDRILASHVLMHAAEGALVGGALYVACRGAGLCVTRATTAELRDRAGARLGLDTDRLDDMLRDLRATVGAPFAREQRTATIAALAALDG